MQQQSSPKIIDIAISTEMLGRYAQYKIQVDQNIISRRFNDFVHFYDALLTNYPGLFVPRLPEKQIMGNLGEDFLQVRRRMLQYFLNSIFKRKILWNSPQTKQFFNEQNQTWLPLNNVSLSLQEKYKQNAPDCSNIEITLDMKCEYYDFQSFVVKVKPMIENFKKMCNNYVTAKTNFNTEKLIFVNYVLPEFEKNLLYKSDKKFFEKIKPLDLMKNQKYDKVRKFQSDQILIDLYIMESDIESYLISFEQIRKWEEKIIQQEDKIRQSQLDLQQTINNQRNAVAKLFFGSKEKEISKFQNQIYQYSKSIEELKDLINITIGQMCLIEIPDFIKEKQYNFFKLIKFIGQQEIEQISITADYWHSILDSRLISQIEQQSIKDSVIIIEQKLEDQSQQINEEEKSQNQENKDQKSNMILQQQKQQSEQN
ncbi:unnamed protein product [Paramecium pentaurelia]|uniref:PX domain-containing protein n=1 Tax=Paramecium pentaurelia TaxID=43138 RepID=A0A8S1V5E0_9CILI|nr:unnamed protein product [Paramecium pentaurelia]